MTIVFIVLFVLMPIHMVHAANNTAAHNEKLTSQNTDATGNAQYEESNITKIENTIKQLQKDITEIRTKIANTIADHSQSNTEQNIVKKISSLEDKMHQLSLQCNQLVDEQEAFQANMRVSYIVDYNRICAELKEAQGLLHEVKQQYTVARTQEKEQLKQFDLQRQNLDSVMNKVKGEISFYADAIEKKLKFLLQGVTDELDKKNAALQREIEQNKIILNMNTQQYEKELRKAFDEKINSIKDFQEHSTQIKQLEAMVKYSIILQALLVSIPVTYIFGLFVAKICMMFFKKEQINEEQKTRIGYLKKTLKNMAIGTGAITLYGAISSLFYQVSLYFTQKELLCPYQNLCNFTTTIMKMF